MITQSSTRSSAGAWCPPEDNTSAVAAEVCGCGHINHSCIRVPCPDIPIFQSRLSRSPHSSQLAYPRRRSRDRVTAQTHQPPHHTACSIALVMLPVRHISFLFSIRACLGNDEHDLALPSMHGLAADLSSSCSANSSPEGEYADNSESSNATTMAMRMLMEV